VPLVLLGAGGAAVPAAWPNATELTIIKAAVIATPLVAIANENLRIKHCLR